MSKSTICLSYLAEDEGNDQSSYLIVASRNVSVDTEISHDDR